MRVGRCRPARLRRSCASADASAGLRATSGRLADVRHLDLLRDLNDKQGATFDGAYVEAQRNAHHETALLMERYASEGGDAELKSFAAQTLPVFRELERKSQELAVGP